MRDIALFIASVLLCAVGTVAQNPGTTATPDTMEGQRSGQVEPPPGGAPPNVFFHTQNMNGKITTSYIAIADSAKPVTGAPYTATATTETTQVLADGNRIVNKTESQLARDSQGRTRRQEMTSNLGPLATNAPKIAFINDPVDKVSYVLDLNDKTARVIKLSAGPHTFATAAGDVPKPMPPGARAGDHGEEDHRCRRGDSRDGATGLGEHCGKPERKQNRVSGHADD